MTYLSKFLEWLKTQDKEKLFKTPMGRLRLNSLFFETQRLTTYKEPAVFTLKTRHYRDYWSFPLLYLELADITEYDFGETCLYNYEHFTKIAGSSPQIRKMLNKVRDELERKVRCEALQTIRSISKTGNDGSALNAAKFLAKREWVEDKKQKAAILRDKKFALDMEQGFNEDYKLLENDSTDEAATN